MAPVTGSAAGEHGAAAEAGAACAPGGSGAAAAAPYILGLTGSIGMGEAHAHWLQLALYTRLGH